VRPFQTGNGGKADLVDVVVWRHKCQF
jgi:hypothetical protein